MFIYLQFNRNNNILQNTASVKPLLYVTIVTLMTNFGVLVRLTTHILTLNQQRNWPCCTGRTRYIYSHQEPWGHHLRSRHTLIFVPRHEGRYHQLSPHLSRRLLPSSATATPTTRRAEPFRPAKREKNKKKMITTIPRFLKHSSCPETIINNK